MYFFSLGGRLGAVYVFFRGRGRVCIFSGGAGWLGAVYVFFLALRLGRVRIFRFRRERQPFCFI